MYLRSLHLQDFRNYQDKKFEFSSGKVVFCGENGKGKTNILEAISLLSVGKSWREQNSKTLIRHESSSSIVTGEISEKIRDEATDIFRVKLLPKNRYFYRNDKNITRSKFFGQIPTLLFCPEFIGLFSETKGKRVQFFDRFLVQIYPQYREALLRANKAHKQKTKLLKSITQKEIFDLESIKVLLDPCNQIIIKTYPALFRMRKQFVQALNPLFKSALQKISGVSESVAIQIRLAENITPSEEGIADFFSKNIRREIAAQKNFIAPHRDDFRCVYRERDLIETASRGESRSILLALISAQKSFLNEIKGINPIMLLDDVFSELDDERQTHLENLSSGCQTFYTTTHKTHFEMFKNEVQVIEI